MKQNRFTSPIVWFSLLVYIATEFALNELVGLDNTGLQTTIEAIRTILVVFGVLNNPTEKEHF